VANGAALLVVLGYVAGFPALQWHRRDLLRFRQPLWAGYGSRDARLRGALVSYVAFGWPEVFMALGWRSSQTRAALVAERSDMREARSHREEHD
jgi:hypothetical protein